MCVNKYFPRMSGFDESCNIVVDGCIDHEVNIGKQCNDCLAKEIETKIAYNFDCEMKKLYGINYENNKEYKEFTDKMDLFITEIDVMCNYIYEKWIDTFDDMLEYMSKFIVDRLLPIPFCLKMYILMKTDFVMSRNLKLKLRGMCVLKFM